MSISDKLSACNCPTYLYNITFRLEDNRTILEPSVPYTAAAEYGEDTVTQRVCLSDSVENCISAIGPRERDLHAGSLVVVRRVNRAHLDKSILVTPKQLFDSGKVPDALEHHEYWYMSRVFCERLVYKVISFDYEHKINWTCIKTEQVEQIINKLIPGLVYVKNLRAECLFSYATGVLESRGLYDLSDDLYDEIVELDWARGIAVINLVMELVDDKHSVEV